MLITFDQLERSPRLAELKVSYRVKRSRSKQLSGPYNVVEYLRTVWDRDTLELREEVLLVCLNAGHHVIGVKAACNACETNRLTNNLEEQAP